MKVMCVRGYLKTSYGCLKIREFSSWFLSTLIVKLYLLTLREEWSWWFGYILYFIFISIEDLVLFKMAILKKLHKFLND